MKTVAGSWLGNRERCSFCRTRTRHREFFGVAASGGMGRIQRVVEGVLACVDGVVTR
jgi:hypothetical protein